MLPNFVRILVLTELAGIPIQAWSLPPSCNDSLWCDSSHSSGTIKTWDFENHSRWDWHRRCWGGSLSWHSWSLSWVSSSNRRQTFRAPWELLRTLAGSKRGNLNHGKICLWQDSALSYRKPIWRTGGPCKHLCQQHCQPSLQVIWFFSYDSFFLT